MGQQLADKRDLDFVIWEQFDGEALFENPQYREFNKKTCELIITMGKMAAIKAGGSAAITIDDDGFGGL